ncbi:unnamed protein product [Rotaria sp. Silwood2]|nr:unnamed protein product [Rotaria sp. Silwood2]CAF2819864.1 unnamed protein product [Rotaria sp. Silwood2]CAF3207124.1 unnamed protein product [Rotaria sp. Silwood2]CAF3978445.1 unnamed protein product [Rotaria sp. Silwood2]CAF4187855.1 unnamed protein product [Rotaria sp. Silwood2]
MSKLPDKQQLHEDQEYWWREFSPRQGDIPVIVGSLPAKQQEQEERAMTQQKKKKSHGNRAEQNFKRRLRHQNLDEEIRASLIQTRIERQRDKQEQPILCPTATEMNKMNNPNGQVAEVTEIMEIPIDDNLRESNSKKRKHNASTKLDTNLCKSLSRLSILEGCTKKKKIKNVHIKNASSRMTPELNDPTKLYVTMLKSAFVPQYLTVCARKLKEMLSIAVPDGHKLYQWLDNAEKIKSTRKLAHTVNFIYYLKLQQQLWQDYFDLGMSTGMWAPRVSKSLAKEHHTCMSYGRSEKLVGQRQRTIQNQIYRTNHDLQEQLIHLPEWTENVIPAIDSIFLSKAVEAMVKSGQHRLDIQFKHKQAMLKLDADDHRLISAVYALKPTEEQIVLIKMYWKAIANEQKAVEEMEVLRKRVSLKRLPQSFDKVLDQSVSHIQTMLSRSSLHKDRSASMASRCSKTITQYKFDLMAITLGIAQDTARGYHQLAIDIKDKLRKLNSNEIQCSNEVVITAIEIRGENIKKRAQELLQYKMMSFFEQAPAVDNNKGNVSAEAI